MRKNKSILIIFALIGSIFVVVCYVLPNLMHDPFSQGTAEQIKSAWEASRLRDLAAAAASNATLIDIDGRPEDKLSRSGASAQLDSLFDFPRDYRSRLGHELRDMSKGTKTDIPDLLPYLKWDDSKQLIRYVPK
jgi:hypothetical protein